MSTGAQASALRTAGAPGATAGTSQAVKAEQAASRAASAQEIGVVSAMGPSDAASRSRTLAPVPRGVAPAARPLGADSKQKGDSHRSSLSSWQRLKENVWAYAFVRLLIILSITSAIYIALVHALQPAILKGITEVTPDAVREKTLINAIISFTTAIVICIAVVAGLSIMGVQSNALITAAGVVSLVIGLAAQSVLKDVLNGLLLLAENQYNIGDTVQLTSAIGTTLQGTVLSLAVRTTTVRGFDGSIMYIPNGSIASVANYSQGPQRALIEVSIGYLGSVETVVSAFNDMCRVLATDSGIRSNLVSGPEVTGVLATGPTNYTVGILAMVEPGTQWGTERYMRYAALRVMEALNVKGTVSFSSVQQGAFSPTNVRSRAQLDAPAADGDARSGRSDGAARGGRGSGNARSARPAHPRLQAAGAAASAAELNALLARREGMARATHAAQSMASRYLSPIEQARLAADRLDRTSQTFAQPAQQETIGIAQDGNASVDAAALATTAAATAGYLTAV